MKGAVPQSDRAGRTAVRKNAARLLLALCLVALPASLASQAAQAENAAREAEIRTRPGITVDLRLKVPQGARALVVLFEGAQGLIVPGYQGFAHRVFDRFAARGIGAVLIGTPAKRDGFRGGLDPRFRESAPHLADIDAVLARLKREFRLPVWLLGVSNGTRSAAAYAIRHSDRIDGLILVSSSTSPPNGTPIENLPGLAAVAVPLLALAHRGDACLGSPPSGAAAIAEAARAAPRAAAVFFTGGADVGPLPCGVETHHQLYGNEDAAVAAVTWFIDGQRPDRLHLSTGDSR
jgi:pimeloyl-ACP methyl ester carboxylesterase